jgi:hypothetical protein
MKRVRVESRDTAWKKGTSGILATCGCALDAQLILVLHRGGGKHDRGARGASRCRVVVRSAPQSGCDPFAIEFLMTCWLREHAGKWEKASERSGNAVIAKTAAFSIVATEG